MNLDMLYVKFTRPIQFCDFNNGLPTPFLLVYLIVWTVGKAYSAISLLTFIVLLYISIWPNVILIYYSHGAQTSSKITTPSHLQECWSPKRKFHCYLSWKWTEICFFLSLTGFNHLNHLDTTCFLPYEKEMQTRLSPTYYYILLSDYIFDVNCFLPVLSWIELTENSTDHALLAGSSVFYYNLSLSSPSDPFFCDEDFTLPMQTCRMTLSTCNG